MIDLSKWPSVQWSNRGFEATIDGKQCSVTYNGGAWWPKVGEQIIGPFSGSDCAREACEAYAAGLVTFARAKRMRGAVK